MGTKYDQLSLEERCEVARLRGTGCSIRQIAAALDRSASSISRELKRNRGQQIGYKPVHAQERAKARRWKGATRWIPAFAGMTNLGTRESVHRFCKRDVFLRDTACIMGG